MFCSSATAKGELWSTNDHDDLQICGQKMNVQFVAQQIHGDHNFLSENKLSMLCNSPKAVFCGQNG